MRRSGILVLLALLIPAPAFAQRADLSGIKICIDPGHGGNNPANDRHVIPDTGTDFWESESNFQKALLLKSLLEAKGASVILTRNTNSYPNDTDEPSLSARVALANANNVHWFHSIHSNASGTSPNTTVNRTLMLVREQIVPGGSAVYGPGTGQPEWPEAWDMSGLMGPQIVAKLRTQSWSRSTDLTFYNWANPPYTLGVLRGLSMPGELSEGSFHDYYPETRRLMNNSYRKMEAHAIREAFLRYFGVPADTLCIVAGIVSQRGTGKLINASRVRILPENLLYNGDSYNNGFYMLDGLSPGSHTVRFETPAFVIDSVQVNLTAGSITFRDKESEPLAAPVVVSSTPGNNDTTFAASGQVRIAFSRVMDTASVRAAFSISPVVRGTLLWSNNSINLTFKPDSVVFPFNTVFVVRIEATARSESGLLLDGNGDGNPGDPFILTFKTRPADVWVPQLISTSTPSGALLRSPNQVINLTFDEPLNPATVNITNIAIQEIGGPVLSRTLEYSEANGRGAINVYPTGGLTAAKSYRIRVSGVSDLSGNAIPTTAPLVWEFSVASSSLQYTTIDDFNSASLTWFQPYSSEITTGIDSASFVRDTTVILRILPSNSSSARLSYYWKVAASDWLLREYPSGGAPRSVTWNKEETRLQVYVHGDGSGTLFRFAVQDSLDVFPAGNPKNLEVSQWTTIDWVGWRLVEWDLKNDPTGAWTGNGKLEGTLRFDSFHLRYQPGISGRSGSLRFDNLQLAKGNDTAAVRPPGSVPIIVTLYQNYPNPFNPGTKIEYVADGVNNATIEVFDLLGRRVRTLVAGPHEPGRFVAFWDGRDESGTPLASGIYLYQLRSGSTVLTRKMLLLK